MFIHLQTCLGLCFLIYFSVRGEYLLFAFSLYGTKFEVYNISHGVSILKFNDEAFHDLYWCINHGLVLTSPDMSHEPIVPKSGRQKLGGSTYECLTIVPKNTCPKSNRQEPGGSISGHITLVINNKRYIRTQNNITSPFINNTHELDITQHFNGMHQKYIVTRTQCIPFVSHLITGIQFSWIY